MKVVVLWMSVGYYFGNIKICLIAADYVLRIITHFYNTFIFQFCLEEYVFPNNVIKRFLNKEARIMNTRSWRSNKNLKGFKLEG